MTFGLVATRRRPTAILCAVLLAAAAVKMLWVYFTIHHSTVGLVVSVLTLALAAGVLMDRPLALRLTALLCLLAAFVLPLGLLNPYAAMDYFREGRSGLVGEKSFDLFASRRHPR